MRLNELTAGDNVILQVDINGQFADFPSVVTSVKGDKVYVDVVRINGKVVGFGAEGIALDLYNVRADKPPMVWKRVKCDTVNVNGKAQYQIVAFAEGYESNRREAYRLFVGISGVAQLGINKRALDVIVKDVSENGFSFVTDVNLEDVLNMPVRLVFDDLNRSYSLMGLVVRKVPIDEKKIIYGCKLSVENFELIRYINFKQRQQLQVNKDNAAAKMRDKLQEALAEGTVAKANAAAKLAAYDGSSQLRVGNNDEGRRKINTVGKDERRDVFKEMHEGKKL